MESPLTKHQLCWIIVRVVGVLFLFYGGAVLLSGLLPRLLYGSGLIELNRISDAVFLRGLAGLLLAFYFLRRGLWIHRLLMFECLVPEAMIVLERAPLDVETGMTAEELELFREWRDANPSVNYLKMESQIARYRESQSK
ncbi:MAG: hypothetical protein P1U86_15205 [Verrucomicrobiales bacterium]|nr:hypothetical protein [Verrucomicrobiales bacterium]